MKNNLYKLVIFFVSLFIAYLFFNENNKSVYITNTGFTQGTTYRITYKVKDSADYREDIEELLVNLDNSLSIYNPHSILSRINNNDLTVIPDKYFLKVFNVSKDIYSKTDGIFDITVAPIVEAWGFGISKQNSVDTSEIRGLLNIVGMDKVRLENGKIIKDNPDIQFDMNAIAQGYSVDVIAEYLEQKRIKNYLVEVGGEVKVKGKNPKHKNWRIGIDKPADNNFIPGNELQAIIQISDKALATSGNYRKFYIKDGIKYSHTINPKTGFPALSTLLSATIIADDCMTADAYATAFMVMGIDKSIEFLQKNAFLEAYFVYSGDDGAFQEHMTDGIKEMIEHLRE